MQQPSILPPYFWELRMHRSVAGLLACVAQLAQLRAHALHPPTSSIVVWAKAKAVRQ